MVDAIKLFLNYLVSLILVVITGLVISGVLLVISLGVFWVMVKISFLLGAFLIVVVGALVLTASELLRESNRRDVRGEK